MRFVNQSFASLFYRLLKSSSLFSFAVLTTMFATAQSPAYNEFLGEPVDVVDAEGEVLNSGLLLEEEIFTPEQILSFSLRYDSDTVITNRNGVEVPVDRIFDVYYPDTSLSIMQGEMEIEKLPIMVVLHAGQGDRFSAADYAQLWATKGYIAVCPSYRSDRLGVDYCHTYTKSIYLAAQDISAVVRTVSIVYDDSQSEEPVFDDNPFVGLPIDGHSFFFVGKSWGGSSAFHFATRLVQEQWEDYLGAGEEYIVDGLDGPVDIGDAGPLHSTGRWFIQNYDMPYERIKGAISRTAIILAPDQLDYSVSPKKVPILIFIGTCDKIVPYVTRTFNEQDGLCDASLEYPDGTTVDSWTIYGPQYISDVLTESDVYNELITFCGGGHDTNSCIDETIEGHGTDFVVRILTENYEDGDLYEEVYRYQFENYSNQCCDIGDDYEYMLKCSCEEDNPYDVIELPFVDDPLCAFQNECEIDPICSLEPLGSIDYGQNGNGPTLFLVSRDSKLALQLKSEGTKQVEVKFLSAEMKELAAKPFFIEPGLNEIFVPDNLPERQLIIAVVEGYGQIRFMLE